MRECDTRLFAYSELQYNNYMKQIIDSEVAEGGSATVYRCGSIIDLSIGPHVPHTGYIKAVKIMNVRSDRHLTGVTTNIGRCI